MNIAKVNLALAGVAVVLAIPAWITFRGEEELFTDVTQVPRLFEGFTPDTVAALILGEPKAAAAPPPAGHEPNKPAIEYDSVQFQRAEKGFVLQNAGELTGAPVNKDLLEANVFKHLSEIRADRQALVQPDASDEQLAEYGLDDAHAFVIKAVNAQSLVLAELLVGKDASGGKFGTDVVRGVFVRRRDSHDVVLYEVPYFQRSVKVETWLDKTVLRAPADMVRKVTLRNPASGETTYEFTRPEGKGAWSCTNPPEDRGALRQTEIESLVQRFNWMVAQEVKRQKQTANLKELGLSPPLYEIGVTYRDGDQEKTVQLMVGDKVTGKNERYLLTSTSNFLMTWPEHFVAPFDRDPKELFDPKAPAPEKPGDAPKKDGGEKPGGGK